MLCFENGGITHVTTKSDLLDMFAMGAAMRSRSDADVILMFMKAFQENPSYALKCLFYIRDVRGGQGERRFFRVIMKWLAENHTDQNDALQIMKDQLELDVQCKTPSLLAKWLKSENTSSADSRRLGGITRKFLGMNHKQYRKTLSILRERINVLERLMSENRWDEIEFDKIPSKAGLKYKNAFARRDIIKAKYEAFAKDATTKVNAKACGSGY